MIRSILLAAAAVPALATPLAAQSQQEQLDARYDRALAAGYKALMLCSAIANAERNGANRTPESVMEWELTGIQAPLDAIVGELPYRITRREDSDRPQARPQIDLVEVFWHEDIPVRVAKHTSGEGCALQPIGADVARTPSGPHANPPTPRVSGGVVVPTSAWQVATSAIDETYGEGTRTTETLVTRRGLLVAAESDPDWPGGPQRTWSVAKSIAATIIGVAVRRGEAYVTTTAMLGANDTDPRRAITIDHLMRMASGRYSDTPGNRTDPLYYGGSTVKETAAHWPLINEPGTVFRYANNDTLMAVKAIEDTFDDHPPAAFFAKLGMDDTVAETDWQGDYILSSQVWSTARDLARLGQLYLDDGVLPSGERILPEGWMDYVSSPSGPQPDGPLGYGAGFWLFNNSEGVPADTFAAMGNRGQYVVIVPSRDIVIVRRGEDPTGSRFDIVAFTRDVLAALEQ